jgi:hypothetical protein
MAQVTGKLIGILPVISGEKDGREWSKGGFVVMTMDDNPKSVALQLFGETKLNWLTPLQIGQTIVADYYPESREYGGKWYTDLQCTRIYTIQRQSSVATQVAPETPII